MTFTELLALIVVVLLIVLSFMCRPWMVAGGPPLPSDEIRHQDDI